MNISRKFHLQHTAQLLITRTMSRSELKSDVMNGEHEALVYSMWLAGLQNFINFMNTAFELNLFEIISKSSKHLTASEIASHLPKHNPEKTPGLLDRMLCLFASFSLVDCKIETVRSHTGGGESKVQRYYALSQAGKYFVRGKEGGSIAPMFVLHNIDPVLQNIRHKLTDAVIKGVSPCETTYGVPLYGVLPQHPESNKLFNTAMAGVSNITMELLAENYKGFVGIEILVDVGGGNGACLKSIISANPHMKGINFDLPHVVKDALSFPGIAHVGGDFLVRVPKGDAIMLKSILHNWDDEICIKLLKNCYEATPEKGKVIVMEMIIPSAPTGDVAKLACLVDCHMLYALGAKERTEEEFLSMGRASGFTEVEVICFVGGYWVIEFRK